MTAVDIIGLVVLTLYLICLIYVTIFCLMQLHLLIKYLRARKRVAKISGHSKEVDWPQVTVQLPVYNERYVIERLIDNIVQFDYPKSRLEIQILDDSTDDTTLLAKRKVEQYGQQGFDIKLIRRPERTGFKAGALDYGLKSAKGEFIAIFDADFLPRPDFLKSTIQHFEDPSVGVVQTRWEHINQGYSLITELQAFQLNVHFTVEQSAREFAGYLLQFNGTAGVWRKQTINEAGGWQADTLTEDLDLSYRAQLKKWRIVYLEGVGSPAELPAEMNGLKSQQYRWMKGGAETAKKIIPSVWRSDLNFTQKFHATIHLLSSAIFVFVFVLAVMSVPLIYYIKVIEYDPTPLSVFLIGMLSIVAVYYVANVQSSWHKLPRVKALIKFVIMFPLFLALSMGLSLHNSIAVLQGYLGRRSAFVRTPKFNIQEISDSLKRRTYLDYNLNLTTIFEGLLFLYFTCAVIYGITTDVGAFLFFHILLAMGFGSIFYYSVVHLGLKK